jgi:hypothetical protein
MMGGLTNPARPWFRLTTPDPKLAEFGAAKEWLEHVTQRMTTAFHRSNLYNALPTTYGDMGVFATAGLFIEEDFDSVIRCYPFPIGSYMIATDDKLMVRVMYRELAMTVRQLLKKFGKIGFNGQPDWSNFSLTVKTLFDRGNLETWINVSHVLIPNPDHDPRKLSSKNKMFRSVYYETGNMSGSSLNYIRKDDADRYLRDSGYDYFQFLAPRWEVTGEDTYGTSCPGMEVLGDIKQLQLGEKKGMKAIDKQVDPPMTGPSSLRTVPSSILPGGTTWVDVREGQQGFRPAHEVRLSIQELEMKQEQVRERISRAFYEDLFLMLAQSDRRQITAREIEERHEEKLVALGPVLEQTNQDLLNPLIDITFAIMLQQGQIPEPPEELDGVPLKVEYISIMAQAQKLIGVGSIERFSGFVGQVIAQTQDPSHLDKVDIDQMIDVYADSISLPTGIVRSDEAVAEIKQQRAQAQKAQQMAEGLREVASGAKDLAGAKLNEDSALKRLLDQTNAGNIVGNQGE